MLPAKDHEREPRSRAELGRQSVLVRLREQIGVDPDRRAELIYVGGLGAAK
jgi:hypothetical protein